MSKKAKLILTNFVTLIRAIGVVALIPIYKIYGGFITGLISASCFLTDLIDGAMARGFQTSTFFGSVFDATIDKLFLIANMILLVGITPVAWIPILLELGIAGVQTIKFKNNFNVKPNMNGKVKMWIAGITISLAYVLVDYDFLNYCSVNLANKVASLNKLSLFGALLTPLIIGEIVTLISYIKEALHLTEEKREKMAQEKQQLKEEIQQDIADKSFKEILFDHDFYQKYQNNSQLMDITKEVLVRKRIKK